MFHRSRPRIHALVIASLALLAGEPLEAQEVGARAFLTPGTTVGVGRPFVLNLEITGTRSLDQDPAVPELDAFAQYLGSGTSTSMQMAGGTTTVSITIQYRYQALREGEFEIGPIAVRAGGQSLSTQPLGITVAAQPPPPGPATPPGEAPDPPGEDLFITAEASRTQVREGEPFTVEYRIWTRVDVTSYNLTRIPEPEGFWVEELEQVTEPQVERVVRDGQQYVTAVIRRVALVPSGPGERTLEPLGVEAQVRVRRGNDPFDRLFGGSSLFGSTVEPTTVLSNPVTVQVEPLPPGRPRPFSGVVGHLDLSARLDRDTVDANDAVTLTVRLSARGNVRVVPEPVLDLPPDFEVFPPEVSESVRSEGGGLSGSKTFEYVMIPRAPGNRTIPAVSMAFFDTGAGAYRRATTGDIPLVVTGVAAAGPVGVSRGGVEQLRQDIRFIRLGDGGLRRARRVLFHEATFWMFALLPVASVLAALGLRRHQDRLAGDVAYARRRRAGRVARKRLAGARRLTEHEDPRDFYTEIAQALRGFVADRLNVSEAGMQTVHLRSNLEDRGVPEATAAEVVRCLEHCDRQRFAPPGDDAGARARFLERAGAAMTAVNRELK